MSRTIKARDVKPGMKIAFVGLGNPDRFTVHVINTQIPSTMLLIDVHGLCRVADPMQEVTVLSEPHPVEPTAFGACGEIASDRIPGGKWQ